MTGLLPMHVPAWHVSVWEHALPSLHPDPSGFAGSPQSPVAGSQVPAAWHWSLATQVFRFAPTQVPFWHESTCVHALLSSQARPFAFTGLLQSPVAGLQVPTAWH